MEIIAFFDIDNTLIKSSRGHVEALLVCIAAVYGIDARIDVINHHGMTDQEIITRILEAYGIDQAAIQARLADCMACMVRKYATIVKTEEIVVMPGVSDLLTRLQQHGVILGLVTGNLEPIARAKLKKIGIGHFFKIGGFGSDHIRRSRLVTIALERARACFGSDNPHRAFHFGDAPQDMQAGGEAGVVPIGVATGVFNAQQLTSAGAGKVFSDLQEADDIIQFINSMKI